MFESRWMGWGGGWMWLFWLVLIVLIVAWTQGRGRDPERPSRRSKSALEILDARYARGEIEREEYEQKHSDLLRGEGDV